MASVATEGNADATRPLAGRTAIVTGASRGIGAATARALGTRGASVLLAARSDAALDGLVRELEASGGRAAAISVDLTDDAGLDRLIERAGSEFEQLDILVNNAGLMPPARRIHQFPRDEWEAALRLNLTAPWYLSCHARPLMTGGGVIVNVSSTAGLYPTVGLGPYNVTKAALTMLTRSCALDWARDGIRVVAVAPGKIDTELARPILDYVAAKNMEPNPLSRIGTVEEVAELIAYLVEDRASFVTGAVFTIDGGEAISPGVMRAS